MSASSSLPSTPTQPSGAGATLSAGTYSASSSFLPSFMIIAALLAFVLLASVAIHLLLRFLSDRSSPRASSRARRDDDEARSPAGRSTTTAVVVEADYSASAAGGEGRKKAEEAPGDEKQRLIDSLPLFTMASALAALPKSSPDCAVCLSPFTPDAELRLLPACRHAFHAACVDAWLRTTPSCPLCRAAVVALPHTSLSAVLAAAQQTQTQEPGSRDRDRSRSRSFVVEIGTVSNRGSPSPLGAGGNGRNNNNNSRTYSLGSFDYQIDEEVEAVLVSRVARPTTIRDVIVKQAVEEEAAAPSPPGEAVAEAAGSSSRGWLREYVDRLASTGWLSGRWSSRWTSQSQQTSHSSNVMRQQQEEPWLWDAEAAAEMSSVPGSDEEETAFMVLYRWIAGV